MRNVLLIEPNYKNKYPPIGLMKLATYFRRCGDNVVFFKGELKEFIISEITKECIAKFFELDESVAWNKKYKLINEYIKRKNDDIAEKITSNSEYRDILLIWLKHYHNYYCKKKYIEEPKWDFVGVTTLFTFYWEITIKTIEFAKLLVKDQQNLMVGGVMATILADEIEAETGIRPHVGTLNKPGAIDKLNKDIIDELPLDYSILNEINYIYPESNAYYGYTTRGCVNKCSFCAVPTLEPNYVDYIPLLEKVNCTANTYGEQRNLLLMDNNVLASDKFEDIIQGIKDAGFSKTSKFIEPNHLQLCIDNLKAGINDRAYTRRLCNILLELQNKVKDKDTKLKVFELRDKYNLLEVESATKDDAITAGELLLHIYNKHHNKIPKKRYVDFNQGVDARLFTPKKAALLSQIPIQPLRIAFDDIKLEKYYKQALKWSADAGIRHFSNYLLYNFNDKPIDLYKRLKINIDLCEEYKEQKVNIYSFPMKYHPIKDELFFKNRNYIGKHWNRKYIRAVQAVLNSTKGKIGKGKSFFEEAFGKDEETFMELLIMPETFIIYRFFFKDIGMTENWRKAINALSTEDKEEALAIIYNSDFNNISNKTNNQSILNVLKYYTNFRKDIVTPETKLYKLKQEYDKKVKQKNLSNKELNKIHT